MREIYTHLRLGEKEFVLVGGAEGCLEVCQEYGFTRYITVEEVAGIEPVLVPLSYKAGYPNKEKHEDISSRVK